MSKIMIFMPNGYEEIEALTVVDFCRRADIEVDMVSITGSLDTIGDHGIGIKADKLLEDIDLNDYVGVVTPGGMPCTRMLLGDDRVIEIVNKFYNDKKMVASICASPLVLEKAKVAENISGTMYPTLEKDVNFKNFIEEPVVVSENVITSRGPATATLFAYEIIKYIKGEEVSDKIKSQTLAHYIL